MRRRTLAVTAGTLLAGLLLATPAHATPEPAPTPDAAPTSTAPADPCALPTPLPTREEVPQPSGPAVLDMRTRPRLPLPVECFVEFEDTCDGTLVTLKNPVPIAIKYRVGDEEGTHTVGPGETEQVNVASEDSPFRIFIVVSDNPDGPKFPVTRHRWVSPGNCTTPSPTPTPSPVPTPAETPDDEPQLPVTGQAYGAQMAVGFSALGLLVAGLLALLVVWLRRRRAVS